MPRRDGRILQIPQSAAAPGLQKEHSFQQIQPLFPRRRHFRQPDAARTIGDRLEQAIQALIASPENEDLHHLMAEPLKADPRAVDEQPVPSGGGGSGKLSVAGAFAAAEKLHGGGRRSPREGEIS